MRFEPTSDQRDFAASLEALLSSSDTTGVARAWAEGEHAPGLALWRRLSDQGVSALATDATPVELVIAFEALGRHVVPGPWIESAAYLPVALGEEVEGPATVHVPPAPGALDADIAPAVYTVVDGSLHRASIGTALPASVDRTRRLWSVTVGDPVGTGHDLDAAWDMAVLAAAAQLLGAGERVLADTVTYVKQRRQFGREIGSYQAIKHHLADVRIALDFARPLILGAALEPTPRAVSAAKVAAADAAYLASRTGLQAHGAIGYTQEFDLSLWLTRIRALVSAWGTPAEHRARILDGLLAQRAGA